MPKVSINSIDRVVRASLVRCGVDEASTGIVLDTIHFANRRGVATHGVGRLPLYVNKIRSGNFNPHNDVERIIDSEAIAVYDANNGFGQVAADIAVRDCVARAECFGIGAVGVRNSNNFGMAGYFGEMIAKAGMAAIIFANASPAIAATGASKAVLGTNPLCYAFPGTDEISPIILDMATAVAARGKVRLAAKNGEKIPLTWATDEKGNPTDDPNEALKGALLPIGDYKGYGMALFVDLFAGMLTGSAHAGKVKPLSKMEEPSRNGHFFIAIDIKRFMNEEQYKEYLIDTVHALKESGEAVVMPGERGYTEAKKHVETVELPMKQISEINAMADELGVEEHLEVMTDDE